MFKKNFKFIIKVMLIHVITYTVCGIIFSMLFKYQSSLVNTEHMRDMNNIIVQLAPVFQIFRGLLFGLIFPFKEVYFSNNRQIMRDFE